MIRARYVPAGLCCDTLTALSLLPRSCATGRLEAKDDPPLALDGHWRVIDVHLAMHWHHMVTQHAPAYPALLQISCTEFWPAHPHGWLGCWWQQQHKLWGQTYRGTKGKMGSSAFHTGPCCYMPCAEELVCSAFAGTGWHGSNINIFNALSAACPHHQSPQLFNVLTRKV